MKTVSALAISIAMLCLAGGCEPEPTHYWYSPMRTLKQAEKDCAECRKRAEAVAAETASIKGSQHASDPELESNEELEGYDERLDTLSAWDDMYLQSVFSGCMRGRGYFEVETERLPVNVTKKSLPGGDVAGRQ